MYATVRDGPTVAKRDLKYITSHQLNRVQSKRLSLILTQNLKVQGSERSQLRHRSDSNQGSNYITIFLSYPSSFFGPIISYIKNNKMQHRKNLKMTMF